MNITQVGIDLAKLVFQVHGVDARGKVALRQTIEAIAGCGVFCSTGAVPYWTGGLRWGTFLGS